MKIGNLTELSKLVDMCRRKGVESLSVDGISFSLSAYAPTKARKDEPVSSLGEELPDWGSMSPEEQMFYSAGGGPLQSGSSE